MLRKISSIIGSCAVCLSFVLQVSAQNKVVTAPATSEITDREKDGLLGPVRRVTVESAKISFKNGSPVEGPRVLRAVTTYDPRGRKIDNLAYPVEGTTPPGKESYKYDDKGNIVEMELRGPEGSVLSKELYKYVLDELGNWKQMTTSLAVFEDGKLGDEPVEVTYRSITYFYGQEIARLTASASKNSNAPRAAGNNLTKPAAKPVKQIVTEPASVETSVTTSDARVQPARETPKNAGATGDTSAKPSETPKANSEKPNVVSVPTVKHVSEEVLRNAALSLPQPAYPDAAELSRAHGRVPVEVIIDERGTVTNARATSGQPLLNQAAERAARSARFSPAKLSQDPAQVTGTITYDFVLPTPKVVVESTPRDPAEKKPELANPTTGEKVSLASVVPPTPSQPISDTPQTSASSYQLGVSYLDAGKPAEAAQALNQAVYKNPENAAAYAKLGLAYSALQKHKEAVAVFKMALRIKRDILDAEGFYQMGLAYSALGKHSDALAAFKQALYITRAESIIAGTPSQTRVPTAEELHYSLGLAYHSLGRFEDAIKELQQVIAQNPRMAQAYYGLAVCYIGMGDRRSAEKQQRILFSLNPALAERIAQALATNRNLPPGVSEGMLGGSRRRP